jgi:2-polyprenyl-3-methyl-5-hydroxy-6-metoxy-1,4-benzoquinol methylase
MYLTNDRSDLILSIIDKNNNIQNVVDLGCNDGATLNGLKNDKSFNAKFYYGVDYSPHILKKEIEGISFHNCDLNDDLSTIKDILYQSNLILLLDVLEHLYDPELFLKKLNKYIQPGSQILITVPNASSLRLLFAWLKKDFPREKIGYFDKTHRSWFTKKTLLNMILNDFKFNKFGYIYSKKKIIKTLQKILPSRLTSQLFVLITKR